MNVLTLEQFTQASGQAGFPGINYPGSTATVATLRYMAALCAMYCSHNEVDFEEDVSSLLMGGSNDDADYQKLASAFSACVDRNMGNRYASSIINGVLKDFAGRTIPAEMGQLLELLEQFLLATGDAEVVKAEAGDT